MTQLIIRDTVVVAVHEDSQRVLHLYPGCTNLFIASVDPAFDLALQPAPTTLTATELLYDVMCKRRQEYPPMEDYLDGVAKGSQSQIQAYVDACLAVKQKYPKPELPA